MVSTVTHQGLVCPDAGRVSFVQSLTLPGKTSKLVRVLWTDEIGLWFLCLLRFYNLRLRQSALRGYYIELEYPKTLSSLCESLVQS